MKTSYDFYSDEERSLMINDYLKDKLRDNYYEVVYRKYFYDESGCDDLPISYLKKFSEEDMELVKKLIKICKEEEIDLYEAMGNEIEKYDFLQQDIDETYCYLLPESIELDTIYHRYLFKYGYFVDSIEEKPRIFNLKFNLTDEEYKRLLDWRLHHKSAGFMSLRHECPDLFESLATHFDGVFSSIDWLPPYEAPKYVIEMTEVDEDVKKIEERYNIVK